MEGDTNVGCSVEVRELVNPTDTGLNLECIVLGKERWDKGPEKRRMGEASIGGYLSVGKSGCRQNGSEGR